MAKVLNFTEFKEKTIYAPVPCDNCGANIEFEENEIRDDSYGNEYNFSVAYCPHCGKQLCFDKNKYKQNVQVKFPGR